MHDLSTVPSFDAYRSGEYNETQLRRAFLDEIESWRILLARNIALRNKQIRQRELNFAVQRTIDRIIFLRICEDRGIEPYGRLQELLGGPNVYRRLAELFQRADDRYNSGLFHFNPEKSRTDPPDELTLGLAIDDKPLKDILRRLYFPDSPYEFSVLSAEILGQVYEQFLGKVIRLTAGHQAKVEEKPEVRKAGGVYYTPAYIVDYIVRQTVGKLLEGKTPRQASKLRVLDPACGSGSFLIGAYQHLLDWHRDWYIANDPSRHARARVPKLYRGPSGDWLLTTAEKKRILLNNIHGVDIDAQAVEVTKLSLLLKVLEGESQETLSNQLRLFRERALPDLSDNIKCGNSLIGPDFYDDKQMSLLDEEEMYRVNVFDWKAEFPGVFKGKGGGFDAVIGNPPYVRMEGFKDIKEYLRQHYACHDERADLYIYFLEREHNLLRRRGVLGMIVSNKFIRAKYGQPLRRFLEANTTIKTIVDLAGLPVFHGATVRTVVLISENETGNGRRRVSYSPPPEIGDFHAVESGTKTLADVTTPLSYRVLLGELRETSWRLVRPECARLMTSIAEGRETLREFVAGRVCRGIVSGLSEAFIIDGQQRDAILSRNAEADEIVKPFLQGRQVRRYSVQSADRFLIYTHHGIDMTPYPAVLDHLQPFRKRLMKRATRQAWYELQQPQFAYIDFLSAPKIVFPDMATTCRFALDMDGRFGANTVYFLPSDDLALLGLLNSRVALFYFKQTCAALEGPGEAYLRFFGQYLDSFPVASMSKPLRTRMVELVDRMMTLRNQLALTRTAHAKMVIERQIAATDSQIDRLVYGLYDLTDDEINIVEEATAT